MPRKVYRGSTNRWYWRNRRSSSADHLNTALFDSARTFMRLVREGLTTQQQETLEPYVRMVQERARLMPQLDGLARSDREAELEEWLIDHGVESAWECASMLVNLDFTDEQLDRLAIEFGDEHLETILDWKKTTTWTRSSRTAEAVDGLRACPQPRFPPTMPASDGRQRLARVQPVGAGQVCRLQMWVASWVRGRGVTDLLMQTAVEAAREDGWDRVVLEVVEGNDRAMGAYRRLGFVRTGRTARMPWDESVTEVEMVLELAPETLDPPPGDAGGDEDCGG